MARAAPTAPAVGVNVRLGPLRPGDDVVSDLRAAGLQVERVLVSIGVVSGTAPADGLERLAGVAGVTSVERDRGVSAGARPA